MNSIQFAALVTAAPTDTASLAALMKIALSTGFMARLARKELVRIGINVEASHDSPSTAAHVR